MRLLTVCSALFLVSLASSASILDAELDPHWTSFKLSHNKQYVDGKEETLRRTIWEQNLKYINTHNLRAGNGEFGYTLKMNKYGDLVI